MPAGAPPAQSEVTKRVESLTGLGLEQRLATAIAKNEKSTANMLSALREAGISDASDATFKAGLVYTAISKMGTSVGSTGRSMLLAAIADGRVSSAPYVEAAAAWLAAFYRKLGAGVPNAVVKVEEDTVNIDMKEFEEAAGVGVVVTEKDMECAVDEAIEENRDQLLEKRYRFSTGLMQRGIMEKLRFADGKVVSVLIKTKVEVILGPKTEADLAKPPKIKKPKAPKQANASKEAGKVAVEEKEVDPFEGIPSRFDARDLSSAENTPELLEKHRKATGGKIVTRFPPEPNGYLHVGHAKAMFIDFGYAKKMGGDCILRFDDTNPTVEKTEYIETIKEMVSWMGHKPAKITFSSDYFEQLFDLAVELIKRGKAYVCHQTGDEISRDRKDGVESPWRNRPLEENLRLFADMRKGKYGEGEATLRMKIDMQHANLVMRDPVAYRVLHSPHPHVGDKWCVYPSYDYTHCIVDSLEWITHSLCTLEFEIRRDSYYWLLEALDLYRPFVWESARLNLECTVMSKRKLKELVERKYVRGWDDPRMPTLVGMRRRGYSPNALNRFCSAVGISRSSNVIGMHVLEHWVRAELDTTVKRVLAVLRPLKVVIANYRGDETFSVDNHPKDASMGSREITLTKTVYIEKTDFRMEDSKGYYGLALGKSAMLRYAYPIQVLEVKMDSNGEANELLVEMDYGKVKKTKGVLHWVGENALQFEARLYSTLFKSGDPSGLGDWLADLNDESEVVLKDGMIEPSAASAERGTSFQFERMGYFCVDQDSRKEKPVFNMTVPLRDSR